MHLPFLSTIVIGVLASALFCFKDRMNILLMGFFRDLARIKARRRRMGENQKALTFSQDELKVLFKKEENPLDDVCLTCSSSGDLPEYTESELREFGDGRNDRLLIGLFGRIYDVSSGKKFYGPNGRYKGFAGRDVSFALSSGCIESSCLGVQRLHQHNFTDKEIAEGKRWLSFFETHDKYSYVGKLIYDSPDDFIDRMIDNAML